MGDERWTMIGEVLPSRSEESAIGIVTTPGMVEAGYLKLVELLGHQAIISPQMAEEVYVAMRQAMGEGRFQRKVGP